MLAAVVGVGGVQSAIQTWSQYERQIATAGAVMQSHYV